MTNLTSKRKSLWKAYNGGNVLWDLQKIKHGAL